MTTYGNSSSVSVSGLSSPPFWICVLLGIVLILAGLLILGDVVLATVISTLFIGWTAIAAGVFEMIHAFWTKGWGGFLWQILLAILYVAFGIVLVQQPVASAIILTYVLGILLLVSGVIRALLGFSRWSKGAGSCWLQDCSAFWQVWLF